MIATEILQSVCYRSATLDTETIVVTSQLLESHCGKITLVYSRYGNVVLQNLALGAAVAACMSWLASYSHGFGFLQTH